MASSRLNSSGSLLARSSGWVEEAEEFYDLGRCIGVFAQLIGSHLTGRGDLYRARSEYPVLPMTRAVDYDLGIGDAVPGLAAPRSPRTSLASATRVIH